MSGQQTVAQHPAAVAASLLPQGRVRRLVVVLADPEQRAELAPWFRAFSRDRVRVVGRGAVADWGPDAPRKRLRRADDLDGVDRALRRLGAPDVVVNLLPDDLLPAGAADQRELWQALFRHLRVRGAWVVDLDRVGASAVADLRAQLGDPAPSDLSGERGTDDRDPADEDPDDEVRGGWAGRDDGDGDDGDGHDADRVNPGDPYTDDAELVRSVGEVIADDRLLVVTKRVRHLLKTTEADPTRLLARDRRLAVTELATLPAGELRSRARVTSHRADVPIEALETTLPFPEARLRHYEGRVAVAGWSLVFAGETVLPDSFRHLRDDPQNPRIRSVSPDFARIDASVRPEAELDGDFYHLDAGYSGHFGHVMSEVVSRLWGWEQARARFPGLKALYYAAPERGGDSGLERSVFRAYGIPDDDIVGISEPTWVRSLVSASPLWHNAHPHHVHPAIADVWRRLADGLAAQQPHVPGHERIFVSRPSGMTRRDCRNTDEVEEFFVERGFSVVHPEALTLAEQMATFRGARVVAGFGGSAMFNLLFAQDVETVVVLSHEAYRARNEHLYTTVIGGDVHYFWSAPDVAHPPGGWSAEALASSWEFDFERNAAELAALLD